jgi:hypothetical protein
MDEARILWYDGQVAWDVAEVARKGPGAYVVAPQNLKRSYERMYERLAYAHTPRYR